MALVGKGRTSGYETETRMNEGRRNGVIWGGGRVGGRTWQIRTMGVAEELRSRRILSTLTTMEWNCRWKTLRFFSLLSFIPVAFFSFFFIKARCINFVANGKWTYYKLSQTLRSSLSLSFSLSNVYKHLHTRAIFFLPPYYSFPPFPIIFSLTTRRKTNVVQNWTTRFWTTKNYRK